MLNWSIEGNLILCVSYSTYSKSNSYPKQRWPIGLRSGHRLCLLQVWT